MRLTWIALVFVALALGSLSPAFAQTPQQPAAAAQQQAAPAKPTLAFQNDAGLMILYIKADKTADFEDLMNKLKDALAKSDAPEAKQQAASLKLLKSPNVQNNIAVYVLLADPVVKNVEYWFLSILYKAFPNDAQALFAKWKDVQVPTPPPTIFDLVLVTKMQ